MIATTRRYTPFVSCSYLHGVGGEPFWMVTQRFPDCNEAVQLPQRQGLPALWGVASRVGRGFRVGPDRAASDATVAAVEHRHFPRMYVLRYQQALYREQRNVEVR